MGSGWASVWSRRRLKVGFGKMNVAHDEEFPYGPRSLVALSLRKQVRMSVYVRSRVCLGAAGCSLPGALSVIA